MLRLPATDLVVLCRAHVMLHVCLEPAGQGVWGQEVTYHLRHPRAVVILQSLGEQNRIPELYYYSLARLP